MEMEFDYVKDDPCYGCRFALPKSDAEMSIDGMFSRRWFCARVDRVESKEMSVVRAIASHDYAQALRIVNELQQMTKRGLCHLTCEETVLRPMCYQKKEIDN